MFVIHLEGIQQLTTEKSGEFYKQLGEWLLGALSFCRGVRFI